MDTYQPIFDAVRSKISNGNIADAVSQAMRDCNFSHYAEQAANGVVETFSVYSLPHVVFRPKLSIDGNMWCALYGDNLQDGVAGFGESPEIAMFEFDKAWSKKLTMEPETKPS